LPTRCSRNEEGQISNLNVPNFIHIYRDNSSIDWPELKRYLEDIIGREIEVVLQEDFILHHLTKKEKLKSIAENLVRTRVFDVSDPTKTYDPFPAEIKHEKELILGSGKNAFGVLYDGFRLQKLLREFLPRTELNFKHLYIVFTNRLFGTWDKVDGRYHARTSVYGFPSIISTSGIVEAPAKPKEFYIQRKALIASGMARELVEEELKQKFKDRFIDYNDERLTEIAKGYAMQAFFYHTTYNPFCDDKGCRLFNAHWQEDMVHAQLEGEDFCERHNGVIEGINRRKSC
jgi:hypothetical protein